MSGKRFRTSAGLFLVRGQGAALEVLIGHPGGPYFKKKDAGAWTVLKGEYDPEQEAPEAAARREFTEEAGIAVPEGDFIDLGEITQKGGKRVRAFAVLGDADVNSLRSNAFEIEWPPRSGKQESFPEIDRFLFASLDVAREKLKLAQAPFLDRLVAALSNDDDA